MRSNFIRAFAAAGCAVAALAVAPSAQAGIYDLRFEGYVDRLTQYQFTPGQDPTSVEVSVLGSLSDDEQFIFDLIVDTTANVGLQADFVFAGGAHYAAAGPVFWDLDAGLLYLSSEQDHPKYFAGLWLTMPLHQPGEVVDFQDLVDFLDTQPQSLSTYAPLYDCGGSWQECSPGNISFALTDVSVTAVPEASTLAMMFAGIAGLAGVATRRR